MKKRKLRLTVLGFIACLMVTVTGCVMVPKTKITGSIGGQPFSLSSPKDSELTGLEIIAATNGTCSIKVQSLKAKMNPEVITTTGAAQAEMIKQFGTIASSVTSAAVTAAK